MRRFLVLYSTDNGDQLGAVFENTTEMDPADQAVIEQNIIPLLNDCNDEAPIFIVQLPTATEIMVLAEQGESLNPLVYNQYGEELVGHYESL